MDIPGSIPGEGLFVFWLIRFSAFGLAREARICERLPARGTSAGGSEQGRAELARPEALTPYASVLGPLRLFQLFHFYKQKTFSRRNLLRVYIVVTSLLDCRELWSAKLTPSFKIN